MPGLWGSFNAMLLHRFAQDIVCYSVRTVVVMSKSGGVAFTSLGELFQKPTESHLGLARPIPLARYVPHHLWAFGL